VIEYLIKGKCAINLLIGDNLSSRNLSTTIVTRDHYRGIRLCLFITQGPKCIKLHVLITKQHKLNRTTVIEPSQSLPASQYDLNIDSLITFRDGVTIGVCAAIRLPGSCVSS
jgi:hypothetical protein